jgi:predicted Zn finger-like uncharacterized protein
VEAIMEKIKMRCPKCSARFKIDRSLLGKKGRCKQCDTMFILAEPGAKSGDSLKPASAVASNQAVGSRQVAEDGLPVIWQQGDVILDLYEVAGVLGEGGMGKVYKVRHRGWNLDLAVKSPKPSLLSQSGARENFEREAETWVNLGLKQAKIPAA